MEHGTALLTKFAAITAALYLVLPVGGAALTMGQLLTLSLVLTVVAYVLGDRMILPAAGNAVAVLADGLLAFLILWLAGIMVAAMDLRFGAIVLATSVIGIVEFFFHQYLISRGLVQPPGSGQSSDR